MKEQDDHIWNDYTAQYRRELERFLEAPQPWHFVVEKSDYEIKDGKLEFNPKSWINANQRELYNIVFTLKPKTVYECGVGAAHQIWNIKEMFPGTEVSGCEISQGTLDLGRELWDFPQDFLSSIKILDFALEGATEGLGTYELVFTQAVTMHLEAERARGFMKNMAKIAGKYIVMFENENYQPYKEDLIPDCFFDFKEVPYTGVHRDRPMVLLERQ